MAKAQGCAISCCGNDTNQKKSGSTEGTGLFLLPDIKMFSIDKHCKIRYIDIRVVMQSQSLLLTSIIL